MKRILPLILALVAGMAQADSNSDYRAGSDFAHQIKGQGSSSIQGFKPQESIPGYNANPDETKYYGGVTAGGDGGLKNDGTTEWATGETGKTITESFMNKPKDILSPDAPFIQTGRDVVNRADSIVGNTGQQCSAQEISRSEYTNYTCERDLQVEQYCTRTARMELQGSTTWETRTLEYEMSQLPAREVNGQYVVSITSPVTGEIVDAHYSWSRTYLQKSVPMTITVLGTPLSWNAKYSADASFTPVQKTLTAGVAFTSSHPVRVGNTKFKRHTAMKLRLVVRVKKASYTPYVVWSESCPFSKELGKLTKTECTEAGGNRTLVKDGQSYSMYQSCWAYRDTYVTQSADKGTCQTYTDNPACTLVSHQCAFYSEEGACLHEYATYSCESKTSGKVMVCGGDKRVWNFDGNYAGSGRFLRRTRGLTWSPRQTAAAGSILLPAAPEFFTIQIYDSPRGSSCAWTVDSASAWKLRNAAKLNRINNKLTITKAISTPATILQIRRARRFFTASCSAMRASCSAVPPRSASGGTSGPSRAAEVVSSSSASRISRSASGTDRPFSHLETVCRTTWSRAASSSWERPLAFRRAFKFSASIALPPFRDHSTRGTAVAASNADAHGP